MSLVNDYVDALSVCLNELRDQDVEAVTQAIFEAHRKGKHIFIMGNGGSAATASHLARDLAMGAAQPGKPRIRAISLTDNPVLVTAVANDKDFESIFVEQLVGRVEEGDVVVGISASGNSPNVVSAARFARENGGVVVGLIGFAGGKLKGLCDCALVLSSCDYGHVEDAHLAMSHILTYRLRELLAGGE